MRKIIILFIAFFSCLGNYQVGYATEKIKQQYPIGKPGRQLTYISSDNTLPASVVRKFVLSLGALEEKDGVSYQWLILDAVKDNGQSYSVYLLSAEYPSEILNTAEQNMLRYILKKGDNIYLEFIDESDSSLILPNSGAWKHLLPRVDNVSNLFSNKKKKVKLLGLEYNLETNKNSELRSPPNDTRIIHLTPDILIGVPHNAKVKNETRRYDESDYEYVVFTKENYSEMIENGMNVFNVNAEQVKWIEYKNVYYWGIGGIDVYYPECLYTSNYIGPAIFFDEPMVHTRDHAIRPKFKKDPSLRKLISPEVFFEEFKNEYRKAKYERSPIRLLKELDHRRDVSVGTMDFLQQNIYTWETMPSSALYQLSEGDNTTPVAMVFEPPGRLGAKRVLPELNMSFDCQIPVDDPKNLFGIIKGFIRGAARLTDKDWGISVYGQVMRSDAYWQLTNAYDHGATMFFYWDSYQLAAVPYNEYLSMSKNLREYAKNFPNRDLDKLKNAAEVAILIPPGYNLGHVKMGIGNFSGLPELNMERNNKYGIKYRDIMNNFYIEIERCIRLGVEYDLFWNLGNTDFIGYREVIDIREDGKVEVNSNGSVELLNSARIPQRPNGDHPVLEVELESLKNDENYSIKAIAKITETTAPVFYTQGAGKDGVYRNTYVLWELYGPEEEDYTDFWKERWDVSIKKEDDSAIAEIKFNIDKPGNYRLRVSTTDVAGRSTIVWKDIKVDDKAPMAP